MDRELTQYNTTHALDARQALYAFAEGSTRNERVRDALDGFDGMSLLDAGCGNGTLAEEALRGFANVRLTLLDASEEMTREALARNPGARVIVGDLASAPFEGAFDRVIVAHALHLVDDKAAALAHLVRHLAPSGRMVLTMHSGTDFPKRREWIAWFESTFANRYKAKRDSLNLQNVTSFTTTLPGRVETELVSTNIRLSSPEPYLRYVDTERHRWERDPSDAEWTAYLDHVRADIDQEIASNGAFEEAHDWGLATIQLR